MVHCAVMQCINGRLAVSELSESAMPQLQVGTSVGLVA